jgi:hypothetical protein
VCFGISAGFVDTYIHGVIVTNYIGDGYIGLLSGISILTAVLLAYPLAYISNNLHNGKYYVMLFGGICFALGGFIVLILNDETIAKWSIILPYFMIHGAARGIWENTNKAIVAEYFSHGEFRDVAFAAVYFSSGFAGAFGYLFFKFMSRNELAILNIVISIIAMISFHYSNVLYHKMRKVNNDLEGDMGNSVHSTKNAMLAGVSRSSCDNSEMRYSNVLSNE